MATEIPIDKTLEDVRTGIFEKIAVVQQAGWLPQWLNLNRGVVRGMIELWAWGLFQLYQFLKEILKQAFPLSSTAAWLDLHCKAVNIERLTAKKSTGNVKFTRVDPQGNIPVTAGRILKTKPDYQGNSARFITQSDLVFLDGQTELIAEVECEEYGQTGNVTVDQITEIVTHINGVDSVTNDADWLITEGVDRETDEALRSRYVLAWMDVNGATKYAYESWARSVPGVISARIMDQHPRGQGTVNVVVRGTAGIPTQALLDEVDTVVQNSKPINDDALVMSPVSVPVDVDCELELVSGDDAAIVTLADERIRALFQSPATISAAAPDILPLEIGDDVPLDQLVVCSKVSGVKKINWALPTSDVAVSGDGLAILNSLNITTVWADEP